MPKTESRRADLLAVLLLLVLPTILFADVVFTGAGFFQRDLTRFFHPSKRVLRETLLSGELPHWNRYFSGGQPMAANPDYHVFYPPQLLVLLPDFDFGYQLHLLMHIHLGLIAMYALLRSMNLRITSALFGAISFGLSGFYLSYLNIPPFFFTLAWLPLVLLFARRFILRPNIGDFSFAALTHGMQHLAGEPTTIVQTGVLIAGYAIYRGWQERAGVGVIARNLGLALLIGLGGLAVGAAQVVPTLDLTRDTVRAEGLPFEAVRMRSMPPARPLELIFPTFMGRRTHSGALDWGASSYRRSTGPYLLDLYVGLIAAVLLIAGLLERRKGALFVAIVGLLSYLIAIGDHTPLLRLLHEAGLFRSIRYPEKFALLGVFTTILFAARTFDEMFRGERQLARAGIVIAALIAVASISLFVFSYFDAYAELYAAIWKIPNARVVELVVQASRADWLTAGARAVAVAALLGLLLFRGPTREWSLLVVVMLVVELGVAANRSLPRMPRSFFTPPPLAQALGPAAAGYRVFHEADLMEIEFDVPRGWFGDEVYWVIRNGLYPRTPASWGIQTVVESDYDLTNLKPTRDLYATVVLSRQGGAEPFPAALLRLANVRWVVRHIPEEQWRRLQIGDAADAQPVRVEGIDALPRYYLATALVPRATFSEFLEKAAPPARIALVDGVTFAPSPGRVHAVRETANTARLDVETSGRSFLVATVTPHRYWSAWIDGRPAPLLRANIGFQGLEVPAGRHTVELRYRNPLVLPSLIVSLSAAAVFLVGGLARRRHNL